MTRKSKREIERRLDDINDGPPSTLSIAQFLSGDWEPIPDEPLLSRDPATGELRRIPAAIAAETERSTSERGVQSRVRA